MKAGDGEEYASFREAYSQRGLLIDDMEWKNALQERCRSNFVLLTELVEIISVHCFPSERKNIYDENLDIILQDFRHLRGRNNSALIQTDRNAESYILLEL